jgi:hypothetical protein
MNYAILIKVSRDINGNTCLSAKLKGFKGIRRQRGQSFGLEQDLIALAQELFIKNDLFVPSDIKIYQITEKQYIVTTL